MCVGGRREVSKPEVVLVLKRVPHRDDDNERLRTEARREILVELARNPPRPQHAVSRPADGSFYIVSGKSRRRLTLRLKVWAWLNLGGFVATVTLIAEAFVRLT